MLCGCVCACVHACVVPLCVCMHACVCSSYDVLLPTYLSTGASIVRQTRALSRLSRSGVCTYVQAYVTSREVL